eukprot:TRINITY_DN14225_c0_g1_i1.p1 TRINITY_DN14225_c0_g1~~TRINITY_DN14225_c0_g1_i1.p1  ORF type:complete len:192 (+),score=37.40 TRINITY_DN14225_c0_g1_i1:173-748(+)
MLKLCNLDVLQRQEKEVEKRKKKMTPGLSKSQLKVVLPALSPENKESRRPLLLSRTIVDRMSLNTVWKAEKPKDINVSLRKISKEAALPHSRIFSPRTSFLKPDTFPITSQPTAQERSIATRGVQVGQMDVEKLGERRGERPCKFKEFNEKIARIHYASQAKISRMLLSRSERFTQRVDQLIDDFKATFEL